MKKCALLIAVALPLFTLACTAKTAEPTVIADQQNSLKPAQSNGYIVTANDEAAVRRAYASLGITLLRAIGNGVFELHLNNDPGIAAITELANRSGGTITAVQPNFSYQAN